ncbi:HNH endonuclease [Pseudomonas juntendi]|uniref:HNH endonuclease n=1 Tax=Pseudomonas juntendi TaxID=2666183 RepID=UPI002101CAB2|nr:HNH endonuclease [Pseudomonas juntendi]
MSVQSMMWALGQQEVDPLEKFVLLCICDNAQEPFSSVSAASIARYTNIPEDQVKRLIEGLEDRRLIEVAGRDRFILAFEGDAPAKPSYRKKVISPRVRLSVFERDGYACLRCGSRADLRADHVVPEVQGGEATEENLQTLCAPCNSWKGAKTVDFRGQGRRTA